MEEKTMAKRIISLMLILTTLFSLCAVTASAAREEEFISDVALIYEDSVEDALEAIAGTDWKLYEQDLNPDADFMIDDGVYLIYKTSTNVEDAITDLRVMDMYGGYSTSNYENQLKATREEYVKQVDYVREVADEFKALYNAGDKMAELAYRQMNYYKDVGETGMLMGDFMLNIPSDDALVTVMMEGNFYVFFNVLSLLAIGISGASDATLATKISELYKIKDTLDPKLYHDAAVALFEQFLELKADLKRYDSLKSEYDLTDDTMTEEEYQFVANYATTALILETIPYGDMSFKDFIVTQEWDVADLYPVVAALSEGQRALTDMGFFTLVLQYSSPSKPVDELFKLVEEEEKAMKDEDGNIKPFDVYTGVDRSIFDGNFAFTSAAERQQSLTGIDWTGSYYMGNEFWNNVPVTATSLIAGAGVLVALAPYAVTGILSLVSSIAIHLEITRGASYAAFAYSANKAWSGACSFFFGKAGTAKIFLGVGIGLVVAALGVAAISVWYGYYNPDYTPIPSTMIDVKETDLGDRYIKYTAAKVYNDADGRNADFNAYQGKEWNALYYTKDATAGNSLTPKFVHSANSATVARRHQGISMFGESEAYNLNSHVYDSDAPGVYLTVRYSTTKKAAADVPNVVGSMFSTGALYTLTAACGAGLGVGGTLLVMKAKKKKEADAPDAEQQND